MKTLYYNITVSTENNGKLGVSAIEGGETIEIALEHGFRMGMYYLALGYEVRLHNLRGYCTKCHGCGYVQKGIRVIKPIRCPDCKGKSETEPLLGTITLNKHDNITVNMV